VEPVPSSQLVAASRLVEMRTPQLKPLPNFNQGACDAGCNTAPPSYSAPDERQRPQQRAMLRKAGQSTLHELAAHSCHVAFLNHRLTMQAQALTRDSRVGRAPSDLETITHGG
jgi:hypothetical protein